MSFIEILKKYLKYDKRIYDHYTTKREFKQTYLHENINKYNRIKEIIFIKNQLINDLSDDMLLFPDAFNIPELMDIYECMLEYPPAVVKLLDWYYLQKLIISCNVENLLSGSGEKIIVYPLIYTKIYNPELTRTKAIVNFVNPITHDRRYSVCLLDVVKPEKIYDYFVNYNKKYREGEIDLIDLQRTFMPIEECIKKLLNGMFE